MGYSLFRYYIVIGVSINDRFVISLSLRFIGVPAIYLLILKGIAVIGSVGRRTNGRSVENCDDGGS